MPVIPSSPQRAPIVLVAGDDPRMRRSLVLALWSDGFRVISACDGAELERWIGRLILDAADDRNVDLIIADHRKPSSTGLEVLTRLRHVDWSTPFILITALADTATLVEANRLGAACVLAKPLELETLRTVVRQVAIALEPPRRRT